MATKEPGPSQKYALQARKNIARLGIITETGGARHPRETLVTRRLMSGKACGGVARRQWGGSARCLFTLKRGISEKKWAEAWEWAEGRRPRTSRTLFLTYLAQF